ncbi:hypothetical protein [Candidatus Fukatsuia endosymbiont of Tuberolachnus salignus]|uniref:hypothetical protein n=1 Tax=Candidatus Fukatsuia endosymbiont of Tuberolachnus salignus TaxID=3077957 RepID=UPI00313DCFAD
MRMGSDSGFAGVILLVLFFPLTLSAQALPASRPVPVPPVHAANDPHFGKPVQAANDTHFRVNAATAAAEQSGFGKIMSRIFSKRALTAGLRGTPQAMAVGLALEATLSAFLSEEGSAPDAVVNQGLNESLHNRTWGELALNKGLLNTSDLAVKLEGENEKIQTTTSGQFADNGYFYLKMPDGSSVIDHKGSIVTLNAVPHKPLFVIVPDKVEPFKFLPSPVYDINHSPCTADIHIGRNYSDTNNYKFTADFQFSSNDLTALAACVFYNRVKQDKISYASKDIISFSVTNYDDEGVSFSGYPSLPRVNVAYKYYEIYYNEQSDKFEKRVSQSNHIIGNLSLTPNYEKSIAPRVLLDYVHQIDPDKIQEPLAPSLAANMVNNTLIQAASSADYQGIPFSTSNPVTAEEIQQAANEAAVPLTKGMLYQQINYFPPPASHPSLSGDVRPFPSEDPDFFPQPDHAIEPYAPPVSPAQHSDTAHPGIDSPSLDNPPDGKQILAPLLTLFPFIKNFTLPVRNVACPVAEFDAFERHHVMNSHCELLEKNRALFALFAGIIWAFLSLRLVLSA